MAMKPTPRFHAAPGRQRGVVLIIALVMLITITFAGLALFRQVGLGAVIVGNLAFKQGATSAADRGVEQARAWLTTPLSASITRLQGSTTDTDVVYFPAYCYTGVGNADWVNSTSTDTSCTRTTGSPPTFDPLTYDWSNSTVARGPDTQNNALLPNFGQDSAGNTVNYVIHRLCNMDGTINEHREFPPIPPATVSPAPATQSCVLASGGRQCLDQGLQFAANCFSQSVQPYYRVTARVQGPRNTLSYVEVVLF
jgi:Tfp pilus assembly protein PilX